MRKTFQILLKLKKNSAKIEKNQKKPGKSYLIISIAYNNFRRLGNSGVITVNHWVRGSSPCWGANTERPNQIWLGLFSEFPMWLCIYLLTRQLSRETVSARLTVLSCPQTTRRYGTRSSHCALFVREYPSFSVSRKHIFWSDDKFTLDIIFYLMAYSYLGIDS